MENNKEVTVSTPEIQEESMWKVHALWIISLVFFVGMMIYEFMQKGK